MIHRDFHSKGYGKTIYQAFEKQLLRGEISKVRIGIIQENEQAKRFWASLGFSVYGQSQWNGKTVDCLEKQISEKELMSLE